MLKKTITYMDYDGNERTEDFYFNLSKAEIAEMELGSVGGLERTLQQIAQTQDRPRLVVQLATDSDMASKFINGILPKTDADPKAMAEAQDKAKAMMEANPVANLSSSLDMK